MVIGTKVYPLVERRGAIECAPGLDILLTLRSPEVLVLVSTPVAEKKMENTPRTLPSGPHSPLCNHIFQENASYEKE